MVRKVNFFIIGIFAILIFQCSGKSDRDLIKENIVQGNYNTAQELILDDMLAKQDVASAEYIDSMKYEIERLDRIKMEFTLDSSQVLEKIRKYVPGAKNEDLMKWVDQQYLESKIIEGEIKYYNHSVENLFRVHPELSIIKARADSAATDQRKIRKYVAFPLDLHLKRIKREYQQKKNKYLLPVTINIVHTLTVKEESVPDSTILKCWLPFPREIPNQQYNVKRITSDPHVHLISENDKPQRTIFMQTIAKPDTTTEFMVEYEFTSRAVYNDIDPKKVGPIEEFEGLRRYIKPRPPHIVFNKGVEELSQFIVGDETNPYLIAKKLFTWIDKNVRWADIREYSTIRSLGMYAFYYKQGDAGIKTFLFMTLCRYNKIPARLVSGWQFQPPTKSLHDWCEIYLEPYGWVPVDVTYGLQDSEDEDLKYFYLGNIDSYRLVFNRDYGTEFKPEKEYFRSDRIDNQRGEIETMDENLYFDKWDWNVEFDIVSTYK